MAFEAQFIHGDPLMVDYTFSGTIADGQVIVVDDLPLISHRSWVSGDEGALAAGGGVYDCIADAAIVAGSIVYWDDTNNKVTETASGNKIFGYVAPSSSSAADGDTIRCVHTPGG